MQPSSVTLIILVLFAIFWLAIGWMRLPRYARYFQLEGYELKRYWLWYWRNNGEKRYLYGQIGCLGLLLLAFVCFLSSVFGPPIALFVFSLTLLASPTNLLIDITVLSAILSTAVLILSPRDRDVKQRFAFTSRAVRLFITAT